MTKKIVTIDVGEEKKFEVDSIGTTCYVDEVLKWLNDVKLEGATQIQWDAKTYWGDNEIEYVTAQAFFDRLETDEEFNSRITEAKRIQEVHQKNTEMTERQKYLELKKKYEQQ